MGDISSWSTTAASNNFAVPDGFPEGQSRSSINNCMREYKAAIRRGFEDSQFFDYGDTPTRTGNTTFTVPGDLTARYHPGRAIKCIDSSNLFGFIVSSAFSSVTTVTVKLVTGNLSASLTKVRLAVFTAPNTSYRNLLYSEMRTISVDTTLDLSDMGGVVICTAAVRVTLPAVTGVGFMRPATLTIINRSGGTVTLIANGNSYLEKVGRFFLPANCGVTLFYTGDGKGWRAVADSDKTAPATKGINAVKFNPTGDNTNYLQWQTSDTDPNKFLVSLWANSRNWNGRNHFLFGYSTFNNPRLIIQSGISGSNINFSCTAVTSSGSARGPVTVSVGNFPSYETGWFHLLWAFDQTSGSEVSRLYIYSQATNSEDMAVINPENVGSSVGINSNFQIGDKSADGFSDYFDGDMAEVYIAIGQFLDISLLANRQKFRSAGGKPVSLGANGATPTGSSPTIYLGKPFDAFRENLGTGSSFTVTASFTVTGTLSNAATYPSD